MKNKTSRIALVLACVATSASSTVLAQDWPQWRGPNRDGRVVGFTPPKTWPQELASKWKVAVGEGVATPAVVGDKVYVFSREDGYEVIRCVEASTGKELWQDKYEALGVDGPARPFSGPRSSPTVAEGKIVTVGVRGRLSCLDVASGKVLWRKDDFQGAVPGFYAASSPIIADGLCIAQLGGRGGGAIVAYDLATGNEKWRATGDSPAYASPVLMTVSGETLIVAQTEGKMVAVRAADGKIAWESAGGQGGGRGGGPGGGRDYKAATPIVEGQTIFTAGRGTKAVKIEKEGDGFVGKELWNNPDISVQFNTPVLKNGLLFGLTPGNELFCVNAQNGEKLWTAPAGTAGGGGGAPGGPGGPGGGPAGGGRGRGGGGGAGFGSIIDAGSVLLALTPASQLIVFEPSEKAFTEVARIKVADTPTHAHPAISGNRVFVKDQNSLALLAIE